MSFHELHITIALSTGQKATMIRLLSAQLLRISN